ncbi:MAG: TnsA endonuclease N-terminal domain-containing protein [Pseudomonadota bacterium]
MPVRKIPKNHLCVTGKFASRKNGQMGGFESLLEKEYMLLMDFDDMVEGFEEQPVNIPLVGVAKGYTPDLLVRFLPDPITGWVRAPLLTEVKHSDDLKKYAEKYAPKFAAAALYVLERGWDFCITTEKEIRTPRLANIKFLREYRNINPADDDCARVVALTRATDGTVSLSHLLAELALTDEDQLYWMPVVWNMVLTKRLIVDLDCPISDGVILNLPESLS